MLGNTDNESALPAAALIEIPYNSKKFEANGHTYYVEDSLSIERYKAFQKMEIELGMTYNFSVLVDKLKTAFELQNKQKFAEVSVLIYQLMEGAVLINEKTPTAMYVTTLFVNRSDENRTTWSKSLAEEKFKDWENINANFFLVLALHKLQNFKSAISKISELMQTVGQVEHVMEDPMKDDSLPLFGID